MMRLQMISGQATDPGQNIDRMFQTRTALSFSVPEGKVCLLCINVFKLLSLHIKYGSYKAYSEKIKAKTVDHNEFLAALAEWIKSHNKDPQRSRMDQAQKTAVKKAQTQLKTMKSTGVEFEAPETFFVAQENWDAAKYGSTGRVEG